VDKRLLVEAEEVEDRARGAPRCGRGRHCSIAVRIATGPLHDLREARTLAPRRLIVPPHLR
jgi:hypothetical protein